MESLISNLSRYCITFSLGIPVVPIPAKNSHWIYGIAQFDVVKGLGVLSYYHIKNCPILKQSPQVIAWNAKMPVLFLMKLILSQLTFELSKICPIVSHWNKTFFFIIGTKGTKLCKRRLSICYFNILQSRYSTMIQKYTLKFRTSTSSIYLFFSTSGKVLFWPLWLILFQITNFVSGIFFNFSRNPISRYQRRTNNGT